MTAHAGLEVPARRQQHGRRAMAYGVLDQGVSSATNFLALLVAANLVDRHQFGHFSIAYVTYTFLLGAAQALFGQVIVLETTNVRSVIGNSVRDVMLVATCAAVPLGAIAFLAAPTNVRGTYLCLLAFLPVLLAQDVLRYGASALRVPRIALASDALWLTAFLVLIGVASQTRTASGTIVMAAWCASGALAFALIALSTRTWLTTSEQRTLRNPSYLGYRFLIEFGTTRAISQISTVVLGFVATVVATGAIRGASTLFGPINVLINSVVVFATPVLAREPRNRTARMASISLGLTLLSVAITVVLVLVPDSFGGHLLGDTWHDASRLMVPIGLQVAALAAGAAAFTGLRVVEPRSTLPIRAWTSVVSLVLLPIGYAIGDVAGFTWSLTLIAAVQSTWAWLAYARIASRSVLRDTNLSAQ